MYAECSAQVSADNQHFLQHYSDQFGTLCSGALIREKT